MQGINMFMSFVFVVSSAVLVKAQELKITPGGNSISKALGKSVIFSCSAEGVTSSPNLQWFDPQDKQLTEIRGRVHIEPGDDDNTLKLYITSIETDDAGPYTCRGSLEGNTQEKSITLELFKEITFDHAPTPQHPRLYDEKALIECRVSGNPKPEVSWQYNNNKIRVTEGGRYEIEPEGLRIRNITLEDDGTYTCRAEVQSDGRYDFRQIEVQVHIPPKITQSPGTVEDIEGRDAFLKCESTGKPNAKYSWFKDNDNVPIDPTTDDAITIDEDLGEITFSPLSRTHKGKYRCKASNDVGFDEAEGELKVIIPPKVTRLQNVTAKEGQSATLTCIVDAVPEPTITFKKEGANMEYMDGVNEEGRVTVTQSGNKLELTITNLTPDDSLEYLCRAVNTGGEDTQNGKITVEYQPRFAADHVTQVYGWPGKTRNLTCKPHSQPEPYIEWYHNGRLVESNNTFTIFKDGSTSSLQISVQEQYTDWIYGNYSCQASNTEGDATINIDFARAEVPDKPLQAEPAFESPNMVVLSMTPPDNNGGVPIFGYRVEYDGLSQDYLIVKLPPLKDEIRIQSLKPSTKYIFYIRAKNEVGMSNPFMYEYTTKEISKPLPIKISSDDHGDSPHVYKLQWDAPHTGGLPITKYKVWYRKVTAKEDSKGNLIRDQVLDDWVKTEFDNDPSEQKRHYIIDNLKAETAYEVQVFAQNDKGWSQENDDVFLFMTSAGDGTTGQTRAANLSTVTVIAILITVILIFLIITDISCFFMNQCGVLMFICTTCCGKRVENKDKALEEGEREPCLAKNDAANHDTYDEDKEIHTQPIEEAKEAPVQMTEAPPPVEQQPSQEDGIVKPRPKSQLSENYEKWKDVVQEFGTQLSKEESKSPTGDEGEEHQLVEERPDTADQQDTEEDEKDDLKKLNNQDVAVTVDENTPLQNETTC